MKKNSGCFGAGLMRLGSGGRLWNFRRRINGIMESLRQCEKQIHFVQVRHEEAAAFMACGYAKYTSKLGVCLATSGSGGIHLLNGFYDAKLDGQPVLAITRHTFHDLIDTHSQQDVDLDRVYMDVAIYNARVMGPVHVANVTHLARRSALSRRGTVLEDKVRELN